MAKTNENKVYYDAHNENNREYDYDVNKKYFTHELASLVYVKKFK